jgi:hypothetical protein
MSISSAPAWYAKAWPSPVYSQLLLVILKGAADAAGGQHDSAGLEQLEAAALALVTERAGDAVAILQERQDRALHVDIDALVNAMVLQGADHLETRTVADVCQARIAVTAEVALQNAPIGGAIEERAPGFQLADAIRRFARVQLRHAPAVQVLAAAHRVGEVHPPVVALVDVGERRRDAPLGHDRVRFAEQRLADQSDLDAGSGRFDRRPQAGTAGADHQDVVLEGFVPVLQRILQSDQMPIEHRRM